MTLPGGIILALDPEWDQAAVEKFFSQNGISLDRTSELDFLDNGFLWKRSRAFLPWNWPTRWPARRA